MRKCRETNTHVPRWSKMTWKRFWSLQSKIEANSRFHKELGRASDLTNHYYHVKDYVELEMDHLIKWSFDGWDILCALHDLGADISLPVGCYRYLKLSSQYGWDLRAESLGWLVMGQHSGSTSRDTTYLCLYFCVLVSRYQTTQITGKRAPSFLPSLAVEIKMLLNEARINSSNSTSTLVEKTVGHSWPIFTLHWSRCTEIHFFWKNSSQFLVIKHICFDFRIIDSWN